MHLERCRRRLASVVSLAALASLTLTAPAAAQPIPVFCSGQQVGEIDVAPAVSPTGVPGLAGGFQSSVLDVNGAPTLAAAAEWCGEDHFNWLQVVISDNQPPPGLTPPYIDPAPGGYDPGFDPTWADDLPWLYDEYLPTPAQNPGGRPVELGLQLSSATNTGDYLEYFDYPEGNPGLAMTFLVFLVSLNDDSSLDSFHPGFSWSVDPTGVHLISPLNRRPAPAEFDDIVGGFATSIPEPTPRALLLSALLGAGALLRPRRGRARPRGAVRR
jgi:hypothetical protein